MKTKKELKNQKAITLIALVITIVVLLILAGVTIASLTGDNGILTRTNEAKQKILNVSAETLSKYGAVSAQCAAEMAQGLFKLTNADIVICTTGVAGPSESEEKSAGLMFAACGYNNNITVKEYKLDRHYNRKNMKFMFSEKALELVLAILGE